VWLAALAVLDRNFSVGMLFAFIAYKDQFSSRVAGLIDKLFELRMLRLHGERVADMVLTEAEQELAADEVDVARVCAEIEVKGLSFRYSSVEPFVLQGIDLKIRAGECIAISGASGSGKTTLVKILLACCSRPKARSAWAGFRSRAWASQLPPDDRHRDAGRYPL